MNASSRILSERVISQYPLSVATSLALESATGIHPEIVVEYPPIKLYTELWINLRTLFRNMLGALEGDGAQLVLPHAVAVEMQQEMDRIDSIIAEVNPGCKVLYYVSNYANLDKKYPHSRIRVDTTLKQKHFTATLKDTLEFLLVMEKGTVDQPGHRVQVFDLKLKPKTQVKTLLLSHIPFDLCSAKDFGEVDLLESHTGAIKQKAQWYTKYLNGKELSMIPFREDFLQIFGDNESFHPYPIEQRREILEIANRYKWTVLTTREKILYSLDQLKNKYFVAKLRSMLV